MKSILKGMGQAFLGKCGVSVDIWHALKSTRIDLVEQHLNDGTDLNAKREDGVTPLHFAVTTGQTEVAALLIANGADVNQKVLCDWDGDGEYVQTPMDHANANLAAYPNTKKNKKMVELFHKHGGKTAEELEAAGN